MLAGFKRADFVVYSSSHDAVVAKARRRAFLATPKPLPLRRIACPADLVALTLSRRLFAWLAAQVPCGGWKPPSAASVRSADDLVFCYTTSGGALKAYRCVLAGLQGEQQPLPPAWVIA